VAPCPCLYDMMIVDYDVSCRFVGALIYADYLVLLAPSATAMHRLLSVCDLFASEYNMLFNAKSLNV